MYKAKSNIVCGENYYKIGEVYATLAKGVDKNDFEIVGKDVETFEPPKGTGHAPVLDNEEVIPEKKTKKK